jgi:DNA mismatch repair protein MSH6
MVGKPNARTPARSAPSQSGASTGKQQRSILGFFSKAAGTTPNSSVATPSSKPASSTAPKKENDAVVQCLMESTKVNSISTTKQNSANITPVPSSDAVEPWSSQENRDASTVKRGASKPTIASSPSRKVSHPLSCPSLRTLSDVSLFWHDR